ncbi:MAG: bifunctional 5,10-methylene-tetrahydrofolate dehydrogenase/5,10-methylene-tetrahydrofolate cyclohydrolase [Solirubrobacterales bacterium 70-9]|nr:MAG: bifunctional 5,10-methylene-tetrahydrofolate dehydrogenase/5,10-methylene-tetrahydrofolate cyclohydrolase [Solirubrobacterales bacterium 70-9]
MAARRIDGRAVAAAVKERVKVDLAAYEEESGRAPGLATVLVGEDPASEVYVGMKVKACAEVGIRSIHQQPPASIRQEELEALVEELNADDAVDGILVQMPLPDHLDSDRIVALIDPLKDVDGLTPVNAGLLAHGTPGLTPCTPAGVMELLAHEGVELEGADVVVVGRSKLVGVPVARLLLMANATVTICHSRTRDLDAVCARADVLVAAVGVPRLLGTAAIKPGAIVIDVGVNRLEEGLVGDVDYEPAAEVAAAITPVPGGVGPMTIAMLLHNTLQAARARSGN